MLGFDPKAARATWTAAFVVLAIGALYLIRDTLLLFTIALMFAYLIFPLFDLLQLKWHARMPALATTFALVLGLITGFGAFIGSHVGAEARQLAEQLRRPGLQQQIANWHVFDIPVGAQITEHYSQIVAAIPGLTFQILAASTNLIDLVIIPILAFFILKDGRDILDSLLSLFGESRKVAEDTFIDAHTLMLQYMRALLTLCLAVLAVFSIVLSVMGVPYAMLLASIAFMLEFIPMVGPLSAAGIILTVSLFSGYPHVVWIAIFLAVYRLFQDYVLSPQLMKRGVELHPLAVIFGVFAGGEIGGVAGIFLSVPLLALARLVYYRLTSQLR
jgi:predicted PurR-regulated permease PerM